MLRIAKVGHGCSEDGRIVTLTFVGTDGREITVATESEHLPNLYLTLEQAAEMSRDQQRAATGGTDPRAFFPVMAKQVTHFGGSVAKDGTPIVDLEINGRMRLSLALGARNLRALIEWLESLEEAAQAKQPRKPN